ncbi:FAD:protein FMN transferase [Saccharicrinis fermentans]|uniref:FAD:protein FMN transferase n=1 Tax=Saccharicrinis fermentans DSM 9555 = JCM 21142 TaxID=869213 RepID=W7XTS8_9BACT|nr:FAD:protein FMN transferase [Saccharicrinis fermentans]GAF01395.1 thiamine biosynthesis lipoprotein ApbE precursor [Saccharicrinis fermentans DSM 9555 = JCM 21142]
MKQILISTLVFLTLSCQQKQNDYVKIEGSIFGTYYHIIYQANQENDTLDKGVLQVLNEVNASLSTYVKTSTISVFNQSSKGVVPDAMMKKVFVTGQDIFKNSKGAFDMTVGPLVNAWGFGFKKQDQVTAELIDSLRNNVGMDMVQLQDGFLKKERPGIMLDASAIAKGFGVDVAADFLASQGVKNYMVEIGGEIRASGINHKAIPWRVGIDKPIDDKAAQDRELQAVLSLSDVALATSGNYRNFYVKDGKKYAHTIDPNTGYPVQHSLLSASIIAPDCMHADAYATACMVMGLEKGFALIDSLPDTKGYFIYVDENGKNKVKFTKGFKDLLVEN